MAFYAGRLVAHPAMENPTLVVLTDRNDLDDQLFGMFTRCHELLRQKPQQANSREDLHDLLKVASGGVIFTTIHKFFPDEKGGQHPLLSDRRNVVVIADEAHCSVFKDKPGRLVVDYLGLAQELKEALAVYTESGGTGETAIDQEEAVLAMRMHYERCCDFFYGFNWSKWKTGTPARKLSLLPAAQEHLLAKAAKEKKPEERDFGCFAGATNLETAAPLRGQLAGQRAGDDGLKNLVAQVVTDNDDWPGLAHFTPQHRIEASEVDFVPFHVSCSPPAGASGLRAVTPILTSPRQLVPSVDTFRSMSAFVDACVLVGEQFRQVALP